MEIIHIVLGKVNPNRLNGVNKVVYNMATEQVKAGKNIQVWGISSNTKHDYPERNFKTVLFQNERFPFSIPPALKHAIQENKNAVFHLHGGWVPVFSTIGRFLAKNKIKYVLTPHGAYNIEAMKRSGFQKKVYKFLFEKPLIDKAYKIHSIGKSEVTGLRSISKKASSFLLPYGFISNSTTTNEQKSKEFIIGFVGRLDVYTKGLDLLIKAFEKFQKYNTNSKLWIIGEGDGKTFLENYIKEKRIQNVILWGKKFGQEKDDLVSKMNVFAHPSRNEGLPSSVLEAASQGVPMIVSHATNLAEYVEKFEAGIAIENDNVSELVTAMKNICIAYENEKAQQFKHGAKQMLEEDFKWSILVEKYDELYK
ncbi:glycosyltransferase [Brumimicrobium aurantiacum]|uniref:Glycosyltransferase n=1 Tax=Brumimicrobium aurantiacum TaxID=1737063 RepID=A0A3E1EZP1_9FLAO|nr:glycosyltransferase [Brumimicrobium aurantiacum]RFC55042.1 glycosyltransferase [Brumimicrobium aurantiacum]